MKNIIMILMISLTSIVSAQDNKKLKAEETIKKEIKYVKGEVIIKDSNGIKVSNTRVGNRKYTYEIKNNGVTKRKGTLEVNNKKVIKIDNKKIQ